MSKNIATAIELTPLELLAELGRLGYQLESPESHRAVGFSSDGGGPTSLEASEVPSFLVEGNGVLVWRGAAESLYISVALGRPRIVLDGLDESEEAKLLHSLSELGINYSVAHEDVAYEA